MSRRPRLDLDGVPLTDENDPYMPLCIFRHRSTEGLVLLIPESAEVLVRWGDVDEAAVDLANGSVRVRFKPEYVAGQNWLRGASTIVGQWLDRYVWGVAGEAS
jgi:hypothetical protein